MSFTTTPNMNLPVPVVGQEAGPQYAIDVNSCLTLLDQHNHAPGSGVQINPSGLDINSALSFNNNFATDMAGITFLAQGSTPAVNTIYENGVDLYFVDGIGNNVRITQNGGIAGSPGSIANLTPPASASYVSGSSTFVWQSNTSIAANMDFGAAILRNLSPNSTNSLTLQPPLLTSNYSITLPYLPASNSFLTINSSGVMSTSVPVPSVGTDGQFYRQSSNVPVWQNLYANSQTKTANYTAVVTDDIIYCSGAAFTITLYTAVGNSGRELIIKKTDSSLANIITISTALSQTIDGLSSYTLNTLNETVTLVSDGSNWKIIDHISNTDWTSYTPSLTGTTTNPVKGTTSIDAAFWRRNGRDIEIIYNYRQTVAGTAGSGALICSLPSNITADTTIIPVSDVTITPAPAVFQVGSFVSQSTSASVGTMAASTVLASSTTLGFVRQQTSGGNLVQDFQRYVANDNQGSFNNTNFNFAIRAKFPVVGWQA